MSIMDQIKSVFGVKKKTNTSQPLRKLTSELSRSEQEVEANDQANLRAANENAITKSLFNDKEFGATANLEKEIDLASSTLATFTALSALSSIPTPTSSPSLNGNKQKATFAGKFTDELAFQKSLTSIGSKNLGFDETDLFLDLEKVINIDDDVLTLLTVDFCKDYQVLPIEKVDTKLRVAFINPIKKQQAEKLLKSQYPNLEIIFVKSTEEFLSHHIKECYEGLNSRIAEAEEKRVRAEKAASLRELENGFNVPTDLVFTHERPLGSEENRVLSSISTYLCQMKRVGGTDLDIDFVLIPKENGKKDGFLRVTARVERDIIEIHEIPMSLEVYKQFPRVLKVISNLESTNDRETCTGKVKCLLAYGTRRDSVQLRINFIPTSDERGLSMSIRLQDRTNFKHNLESIGLTPSQRQLVYHEILTKNSGLVLVVGPVNQGKNTTALSLLIENNNLRPNQKTITVEDPIEYDLLFGVQVEVSPDRSYSYYLKSIIRHNLDNLYIGEIRDSESADLAVQAANLGHRVVSTIHTSCACEAVARLRATGISPYQLANSLRTVISQRLIKRSCKFCVRVSDDIAKTIPRLGEYVDRLNWQNDAIFTRASGFDENGNTCRNCQGTGYRGVTAIFEILKLSRKLRKLISDGITSDELKFQAHQEGFKSLWYSGLEKVLLGETTLEQILTVLDGLPDPDLEGLPALESLEKTFYDSFEDILAN
ncbi:MAG: ATPase, T2SS/T4P/T4SS family [Blastocatellia bacterium]